MMNNLEYYIGISPDSVIDNYSYSEGVLIININLMDLDNSIKLKIKTDVLSVNSYYLNKKEELFRTCRLELNKLSEILDIKNNIYVPANDFGKFMNESKLKYNLAYGKKSSSIKYSLSLIGYDVLISCLIEDVNSIEILKNK